MTDPIAQIVFLLRAFCLLAIFYLAMHKIMTLMSLKPNSKLLWFFAELTAPLTSPVKKFSSPDATDDEIVTYSMILYGLVWTILRLAGRYWLQ